MESGAGGIRTLVQTRDPYAFYMLILSLHLDLRPGTENPLRKPKPHFIFPGHQGTCPGQLNSSIPQRELLSEVPQEAARSGRRCSPRKLRNQIVVYAASAGSLVSPSKRRHGRFLRASPRHSTCLHNDPTLLSNPSRPHFKEHKEQLRKCALFLTVMPHFVFTVFTGR